VAQVARKVRGLLYGLRMIRNKLTEQQARTLVTAQVLAVLCYASPVWLTPHLMAPELRKVDSVHFRSPRVTIKDYKQRVGRDWVSAGRGRLPPKQCRKFAASSIAIKIRQSQKAIRIIQHHL